jgi:S-DNA-T family DNA segregation ATPase FtsK/SpoIIIE
MPSNRRQRIIEAFDDLHDAIGGALGAAHRRRDVAVQAHTAAMVEGWLRADGLGAALDDPGLRRLVDNPRLRKVVGVVEADRLTAFAPWLGSGPDALRALIERSAPGVAGKPRVDWSTEPVGEVESHGAVPGLWYVGQGWIGDQPPEGFPVAVPLLDEAHLQISSSGPDGRAAAEELVQNLLLRVLGHFRPGLVRLHLWDVGSVTGTLPGLYPLTRNGLLTVHDPSRLPQLLEDLANRIRRIHTRVLVDGHPSLRALAADPDGDVHPEPWVVAVLVGNQAALREEDHQQLQRVARGGLACRIQLVLLDLPATLPAAVETIRVAEDGSMQTSMTGPHVRVEPEPGGELRTLTAACDRIATGFDDWSSRVHAFDDLRLDPGNSSIRGLEAPIGFVEGEQKSVHLDDRSPHALVGGPSGSGKTNLLLTMIMSLAARYGPDEVEFYLLDFKEGVSFAQFAPLGRRTTWLPHARLIGVNVNTDREFGLALLRFLSDTMRERAALAKAAGVTKLEELRGQDPRGRWPRIVAVIDEFQYLFAENDAVGRAAAPLLEDVARRGRSQGIHLVLASQDTSGIQSFWGRPAVFEQFVLRIALPRARRVLVETNDAAVGIPRWHAVVNHESGTKHDNVITRVPNASAPGLVDRMQKRLFEAHAAAGSTPPTLFDGSSEPRFDDLLKRLPASDDEVPRAMVGQRMDVAGRPATVRLTATPGRNIAVLASIGKDALPVLTAAAGSLAEQYAHTTVTVVLAPLVVDAGGAAAFVAKRFRPAGYIVPAMMEDATPERPAEPGVLRCVAGLTREVDERLAAGRVGPPVLLVLFAADAAETALGREGTDALRKLLRFGPETGVHVLGWWRSAQRLRSLLTMGTSVDDLGAWVALDVHGGTELGPLVPGMQVSWSPRPGRGLFFDRAQHAQPEVIIVPVVEGI